MYPLFTDVKVGDKLQLKFETGGWNNAIYTVVDSTDATDTINTDEYLLVRSSSNTVAVAMDEVIDKKFA